MNNNITIFLRSELNNNEKRTPLTPSDIKILLLNNIKVYVQSSKHRIFDDSEYSNIGAIIVNDVWYDIKYKKCLIIGLKELNNLEMLDNHIHLFFAHSYKNQVGSQYILQKFKESKSILYDFEYFLDENNKRIISFGIYAGYVGAILGLKQYYTQNINNLHIWLSYNNMLNELKNEIKDKKPPIIGIVGYKGNCGKGVIEILDKLNFNYEIIEKYDDNKINKMKKCDILYNCINLNNSSTEIWFDQNTIFSKKIIITDISCDYTKPNNPIKIYNTNTTFENPVLKLIDKNLDIIAIDNLPSLLPKDSSEHFSKILLNLILKYKNDEQHIFSNNENIYNDNIRFI